MAEPMADARLEEIRLVDMRVTELVGEIHYSRCERHRRELLAEVDRLRGLQRAYLSELRDYGTTVMRLRQRIREMEDS